MAGEDAAPGEVEAPGEGEAPEEVLETFPWTIQYTPAPREGRMVRTAEGVELRYQGIDGHERRVPVDLDYQPPSLDVAPPELQPFHRPTTEIGFAARALLGWMSHGARPYGTVVPFEIAAHVGEEPGRYAGRLERHSNAPFGVSVYVLEES